MNAPDRTTAFLLDEEIDEKKITAAPDLKIENATLFTLNREDHTMGNLLRMQLLRDPNVRFVGYMMPHPLIMSFNLKVQTNSNMVKPTASLLTSVEDLSAEVDHLNATFDNACRLYKERDQGRK